MADRYLVFARSTLIDSASVLPHLLAGCQQALGLRDREALVQVGVGPSMTRASERQVKSLSGREDNKKLSAFYILYRYWPSSPI
jgi:hypothetical protein